MDSILSVYPINGNLLTEGYLESWDGLCRYVHGLDQIGLKAEELGACLFWDLPEILTRDAVAVCAVKHNRIYLKPWLYKATPMVLRRVLDHELAHCWLGFPEVNVENWEAIVQGGLGTDCSDLWPA